VQASDIASRSDCSGDVPDCSPCDRHRDAVLAQQGQRRQLRFAQHVEGARQQHRDGPAAAIARTEASELYSTWSADRR
jgi:hypothetical protein